MVREGGCPGGIRREGRENALSLSSRYCNARSVYRLRSFLSILGNLAERVSYQFVSDDIYRRSVNNCPCIFAVSVFRLFL